MNISVRKKKNNFRECEVNMTITEASLWLLKDAVASHPKGNDLLQKLLKAIESAGIIWEGTLK